MTEKVFCPILGPDFEATLDDVWVKPMANEPDITEKSLGLVDFYFSQIMVAAKCKKAR